MRFFESIYHKIMGNLFLRASAMVFFASFFVNVLNYIFNILAARLVDIEVYGEYTTLASLLILFIVPSAAITMLVSREVATNGHDTQHGKTFLDKTFAEVLVIAFFVWLVFLLMVPILTIFLSINFLVLLTFSFLIPVSIFNSFQVGIFQGKQDFLTSSIINIVIAFSKLGLSLVLLYLGFSIYGIILALFLASVMGILYDTSVYKERNFVNFRDINFSKLFSNFFAITFFTTLSLAVLQNIDVILAKHFLTATEAGAYGALSTMGKIVIFVVGSFVTVMMPMISKSYGSDTGGNRKLFGLAMFAIVSLGSIVVFCFNFFSEFFVHVLFGDKYSQVATYIGEFSIAMLFIAISIAFVNFFIAIRDRYFVYLIFVGLFIELFLLWYTDKNIGEYVFSVTISSFIILVLLISNFIYISKKQI